MASKATDTQEEQTGTGLALFTKNTAIAELGLSAEEMDYEGDLGYSTKAEDTLVPIVSILQDNSGEVKKQHAKRIEGADAGDLIIRAFKKVIKVSKENPFVFQPAGFVHMWVEWEGDIGEGAVVGQFPFDDRPADAVERIDPADKDGKRKIWVRENGNRLADTRYHYGQAIIDGNWMPVVMPFGGTNHTVSRQWTGQMKALRFPNGKPIPAWFRAYAISTAYQSRGAQSWFNYNVDDLGFITSAEVREEGRKINESLDTLTPVLDGDAGTATDDTQARADAAGV